MERQSQGVQLLEFRPSAHCTLARDGTVSQAKQTQMFFTFPVKIIANTTEEEPQL